MNDKFMNDKLIVRGNKSDYQEPLNSIIDSSFQISWQENDNYQMQFTAYSDNSIAFESLGPQASIFWQGQEFICKQPIFDFKQGQGIKQVIAVHVYSDVGRVFQRNVNEGVKTYAIDDVLAFFLADNEFGYTYQVIGDFPKQQIENLGGGSGKDMLSKIRDTWPDAIVFPDNKCLKFYQHDVFAKDLGNRIDYLHDTNEIKITYDCTNLLNKLRCIGKQKDEDQGGGYYFDPFYVQNDESIATWGIFDGGDVSDDRFTDAGSMKAYGESKLSPEPIVSISVTQDFNQPVIPGEIRRLEIRPQKYVTKVEVVAFTTFPKDPHSPTQITLNNKAMSILRYNNRLYNKLAMLSNTNEAVTNLQNSYDSIVANQNKSSHAMDQAQKDIYWLSNGQYNLVLNGDLHADNLSYFRYGGDVNIDENNQFNNAHSIRMSNDSWLQTNANSVDEAELSARVFVKSDQQVKPKMSIVFFKSGDGTGVQLSTINATLKTSADSWGYFSLTDIETPKEAKSFRLEISVDKEPGNAYFTCLQINKGYKLTDWLVLNQPKLKGE